MIIATGGFSKNFFINIIFYFLEILLNNLEFGSHLQNTKNKSVFFLSIDFLLIVL